MSHLLTELSFPVLPIYSFTQTSIHPPTHLPMYLLTYPPMEPSMTLGESLNTCCIQVQFWVLGIQINQIYSYPCRCQSMGERKMEILQADSAVALMDMAP